MADESEVLKDEPVDRESSFNTEVLQNIPVNISVEGVELKYVLRTYSS